MNILITGANGFIGMNLYEFLSKDYGVFCLDFKKREDVNIKNQIIIDLINHEQVAMFFDNFKRENQIDVIIHLAAVLASIDNARNLDVLYENLRITEAVVIISKLLTPKKILNLSSMALYPNKNGVYTESSEVRPSENSDCLYGLSKFCSENILDFLLKDKKIAITHFRSSQIYGKGLREDRIIPIMIKELREKNTITVFGNGERVSSFIHIDKLLEKVDLFLKQDINGIYNIAGEHLSFLELAERLIKQYGNEASKIIQVQSGSRVKFYLDDKKINSLKRHQ